MSDELHGKRIAILFTDGVEESELMRAAAQPCRRPGARIDLLSIHDGPVQATNHGEKGETVTVDRTVDQASPDDYEGLVLPGGVANPDKLRMNEHAVEFVRQSFLTGVPIAVICHGPWTMVEADVVRRPHDHLVSERAHRHSQRRRALGRPRGRWSTGPSCRAATRPTCPPSARR